MMQQFENSEATAARRHIYLHLVDATDGISAETGLTGVGRISKNGATTAATSGSLVEIDSTNMPGRYYIVLTATELDTDGMVEVRYKAAACAEGVARAQVVPWDPYAITNMGLTALPAIAAEAAGGLYTQGSGAGQINQTASGQVDVNVAAMVANVVTATSINADAITGAKLADDCVGVDQIGPLAVTSSTFAVDSIRNTAIQDNAITAGTLASNSITAVKIASGTITALKFGTDAISTAAWSVGASNEVRDAILDALTASFVVSGSVGEVLNNLPNDGALTFLDASILARTLATAAYFDPAADTVVNVTSVAALGAGAIGVTTIAGNAISSAAFAIGAITSGALAASAVTEITDDLLDEPTASHVIAGSVGLTLDNLPNDGALTFLDQSVAANATPAEVLTQVNTALDTAISELSVGVPDTTPSLRNAVMLGYMAIRNRFDTFTSGSDAIRIYNNAGAIIATKAMTDSGGDYSEALMISG